MQNKPEILAPAGSMDSLIAAVRTGANAVYLGASELNARQSASNFDKTLLKQAVSYCHARGVKVHQTINTVVFDDELPTALKLIEDAAEIGVDALIIQDLSVLELAKKAAPSIPLHASTQMSTHNLEGVLQVAELGFSRVVLARELSLDEIRHIVLNSPIEIECFVHGALCVSMSGGCYFSSMIGGRSGNRGRCAQTCRLPFATDKTTHSLSLKDLSAIEFLPELAKMGVASFKIEGRLKRPEYVAAAVTACEKSLAGANPDYSTLQSVFSRSGFTQGYLKSQLNDTMFGTRTVEDVKSTAESLKSLAGLYKDENPLIPVNFMLEIKAGNATSLTASCGSAEITVEGQEPQQAISSPTDKDKALRALQRTGGTPFFLESFECNIDPGLIVPASELNRLRREALENLLDILSKSKSYEYFGYTFDKFIPSPVVNNPQVRVRLENRHQLWEDIFEDAAYIILPIAEALHCTENKDQIIIELPYYTFSESYSLQLKNQLEQAKVKGFTKVLCNGLDTIHLANEYGFDIYGGYRLNTTNQLALKPLSAINVNDITMSIEYPAQNRLPQSNTKRGIIAYGNLPMMVLRKPPAGISDSGYLTDRLGNKFYVDKKYEYSVVYNSVPLVLSDSINSYNQFNFYILYFTTEEKNYCKKIFEQYKNQQPHKGDFTRGLYKRKVL